MVTMPFLAAVITENRLPNPGHHRDIDRNEDLVAVIVGDKALQHAFRRTVQLNPGSENLAGRSEMHLLLQTVLEVADDGVIEVVA